MVLVSMASAWEDTDSNPSEENDKDGTDDWEIYVWNQATDQKVVGSKEIARELLLTLDELLVEEMNIDKGKLREVYAYLVDGLKTAMWGLRTV